MSKIKMLRAKKGWTTMIRRIVGSSDICHQMANVGEGGRSGRRPGMRRCAGRNGHFVSLNSHEVVMEGLTGGLATVLELSSVNHLRRPETMPYSTTIDDSLF